MYRFGVKDWKEQVREGRRLKKDGKLMIRSFFIPLSKTEEEETVGEGRNKLKLSLS